MRRHDQPRLTLLQPREIVERPHGIGAALEVQQQHVLAFNRPLDSGNQRDASLGRIAGKRRQIQLAVVERDGQRLVPQRRSSVDQLERRVGNAVDGVVARMGVQLDFQHVR